LDEFFLIRLVIGLKTEMLSVNNIANPARVAMAQGFDRG
jgi:hypothetical protein